MKESQKSIAKIKNLPLNEIDLILELNTKAQFKKESDTKMIPNEDCQRHTDDAIECLALWKKHKESIDDARKSDDLQSWVTAGINSYGFAYAARYHKFLLSKYLKVPSKFYDSSVAYKNATDLFSDIDILESEAVNIWFQIAPRVQSSLEKKEWRKYLIHLDETQGKGRYGLDLGIL